jgi:hypothetical protein
MFNKHFKILALKAICTGSIALIIVQQFFFENALLYMALHLSFFVASLSQREKEAFKKFLF